MVLSKYVLNAEDQLFFDFSNNIQIPGVALGNDVKNFTF